MKRQKLRYICTPQWLRDNNGALRKAYRLHVLDISGKRPCLLRTVNDVCSSQGRARQLEALLCRNQVSPRHVLDVLEDWLP